MIATSPHWIKGDTPIGHGQLSPRSAAVRQARCRQADHLNVYRRSSQRSVARRLVGQLRNELSPLGGADDPHYTTDAVGYLACVEIP